MKTGIASQCSNLRKSTINLFIVWTPKEEAVVGLEEGHFF
jgi:hypothetical protein